MCSGKGLTPNVYRKVCLQCISVPHWFSLLEFCTTLCRLLTLESKEKYLRFLVSFRFIYGFICILSCITSVDYGKQKDIKNLILIKFHFDFTSLLPLKITDSNVITLVTNGVFIIYDWGEELQGVIHFQTENLGGY